MTHGSLRASLRTNPRPLNSALTVSAWRERIALIEPMGMSAITPV